MSYRVEVEPEADGFRVSVQLDQSLPAALAGKAGFNLEFLPTAYFGKSFVLDEASGVFPRHPDGPMQKEAPCCCSTAATRRRTDGLWFAA